MPFRSVFLHQPVWADTPAGKAFFSDAKKQKAVLPSLHQRAYPRCKRRNRLNESRQARRRGDKAFWFFVPTRIVFLPGYLSVRLDAGRSFVALGINAEELIWTRTSCRPRPRCLFVKIVNPGKEKQFAFILSQVPLPCEYICGPGPTFRGRYFERAKRAPTITGTTSQATLPGGGYLRAPRGRDVQISPDGLHVAYIRIAGDIMTDRRVPTLWVVDVAGGSPRALTPQGRQPIRVGRRMAKTSHISPTDAGSNTEIYTVALATGATRASQHRPRQPPSRSPFWSHSPLSLVGHVTTPILLMDGEDDRRTPFDQTLEFYTALTTRAYVPVGLFGFRRQPRKSEKPSLPTGR